MTNKEKVLSRWPKAVCLQDYLDLYTVWNYNPQGGLWGISNTELGAWADAVRKIEQYEGRKLPV